MTKILIIEDEMILRGEVAEWLTLEGYVVIQAADGVEGLEKARAFLPDLIVCDITMPRLDGHAVLIELRAHSATDSIPFIFMTARAVYEDVRLGMDLGADDYITKPFSRLELLQAIQTRLNKKATIEQKRQQEVNQLQEALTQEHEQRMLKMRLVAMFSHDFRNPLAGILASSNILRDYSDRLDENRRQEHFNRIDGSVRRLLQMLDDMLITSQLETNSFDFKPESLQPAAFFRSIVEDFQAMDGDTHQIVYESHFHDSVMADPRLLQQIAANLISNAVKYSPGGGEVRVLLEAANQQFTLTIQDQGIGIPQADQSRLFQAFQRASNVGKLRGTGLGLAIVQQAATLHGGTVQLESEVGQGTSVYVTIPA